MPRPAQPLNSERAAYLDLHRGGCRPQSQSRSRHHVHRTHLELVKRAHVIRVLEETNWIVGGPRGAAARLGMKRTTLQSYMKRLAIERRV